MVPSRKAVPFSNAPLGPACRSDSRSFTAACGLWAATGICTLLAASPCLASLGYMIDLLANLSYFAAVPLSLIIAAAVWTKRFALSGCALVAAIAAVMPLAGEVSVAISRGPAGRDVSLLFCNIEGNPLAWDRLRRIVDRTKPDIVVIVEIGAAALQRLATDSELTRLYPYQIKPQPGFEWSQVVLSRHALERVPLAGDFERYKFLYTFARASIVKCPQGSFIISTEHVPSPRSPRSWALGNEQIRLLGELVRGPLAATGLPFVVAGDFNSSPTGYRHRLLQQGTGLHADPLGFPPRGTWPSLAPSLCRLFLDRVWASDTIEFSDREVLEHVGSDHRPIMVHFHACK